MTTDYNNSPKIIFIWTINMNSLWFILSQNEDI